MKKIIVSAVLLLGIAGAGMASAGWQQGEGKHMRNGNSSPCSQQVNRDDMFRFRTDNQAVLKKMAIKMSQQRALYRGQNPDPVLAGKLSGEIFTLRNKIQNKAFKAGMNNSPYCRFLNGPGSVVAQTQVGDQVSRDKIVAFNTANKKLRRGLAMKLGEKRALMRAVNPDLAQVAAVTGDIFDLRTSLQDKAKKAGVPAYFVSGSRGPGPQYGCPTGAGRRGHGFERGGHMGDGPRGNGPGMYQHN
ncbi:hypothetical protein [Desulfotalea psychrophila]|nr:hypothetical protein [Desulfotalea psychrophila]